LDYVLSFFMTMTVIFGVFSGISQSLTSWDPGSTRSKNIFTFFFFDRY